MKYRNNNAWSTLPNTLIQGEKVDGMSLNDNAKPEGEGKPSSRGTQGSHLQGPKPILANKGDPLRMSPRSLGVHLSIEQERKLKQIEAKQLES